MGGDSEAISISSAENGIASDSDSRGRLFLPTNDNPKWQIVISLFVTVGG